MYSADDFAKDCNVPDDALELYQRWHALLVKWNQSINLVQSSSLDDFWFRHARDSHQITRYIPKLATQCLDLGSGAGFPGLSVAIALKDRKDTNVTLVESAGKKTSFLRAAIRELRLPASASSERAESLTSQPYDLITARAFAPLPKLLDYAERFWGPNSCAILPKGQSADIEIAAAKDSFAFDLNMHPSETDPEAKILIIKNLKRLR